jgi:threonine dehydrogenase-like Zn-dependent dehydrogenase
MKQLFVNDRGKVLIRDVDYPKLEANGVIVKTVASMIGVGSEIGMITGPRKNPGNGKEERPLTYQSAGVIVEKSEGLAKYQLGDLVACTGMRISYHAEFCYMPINMIAEVPEGVTAEEAASNNVGLTALHASRRGRINLGETVVVIGLGMVGQLTAQIAKARGAKVVGVDLIQSRVEKASELGAELSLNPQENDVPKDVRAYTGLGADVAVVCARSSSAEPLEEACLSVRHGGRVVIVGAVKREIPSNTQEIDILISRGRGIGYGEEIYERRGVDYPEKYVRWTENRNLQEYLRLIAEGRINVQSLTTHRFPLGEAEAAYETVIQNPEEALGVILQYD